MKHTTSSTPRQQAHRVTDDGIKKPLNPFLGELFLASWTDSRRQCRSRLVAEQVSHHPPVTAVHISDPDHGVTADGYARVEMTFSPAQGIRVRQIGHAVLHVDSPAGSDTDESYLVPLFDVHVRGLLSGSLYPEVLGTYRIVCSNGLVAEMKFTGESGILGRWGGGRRNAFTATIYDSRKLSSTTTPRQPIYEAEGVWSSRWTIRDARTGETVESWDADDPANAPCPIELPDEEDQDPWESRRAWAGVTSALREGDLARAAKEKTKIEQAQRAMRRHEKEQGKGEWQQLLFKRQERRKVDGEEGEGEAEEGSFLQRLLTLGACAGDGWELGEDKTKGVWAVDLAAVESMKRPFRDGLTPLG